MVTLCPATSNRNQRRTCIHARVRVWRWAGAVNDGKSAGPTLINGERTFIAQRFTEPMSQVNCVETVRTRRAVTLPMPIDSAHGLRSTSFVQLSSTCFGLGPALQVVSRLPPTAPAIALRGTGRSATARTRNESRCRRGASPSLRVTTP